MIKVLIDTDAFCKLGVAGLLDDTATLFAATLDECARLPALPYMLRKGALRKLYGGAACDDLHTIALSMPLIPQPSEALLDQMNLLDTIDPGEAQIFAAASEYGVIAVTGDKRALNALKGVDNVSKSLAGRIAVLEAVLLALCTQCGVRHVQERIAPLSAVDRMVSVCFSAENPDPARALVSYLANLAENLAPISLWTPCA